MSNIIINFHEVKDSEWFEKVIAYLKRHYKMISAKQLDDYYHKNLSLKNACLITVDDGHISSYNIIYPILKKHGVPAIFFVSPQIAQRTEMNNFWFQEIREFEKERLVKCMADEFHIKYDYNTTLNSNFRLIGIDLILRVINRYKELYCSNTGESLNMTANQIVEIDKEGLVEIGAHTMTHPFLAIESNKRAKQEIIDSINNLELLLSHPIRTFAYPNGTPFLDFGEREIEILKTTSVRLAFSTEANCISLKDNVYAIPRYGLTHGSLLFITIKLVLGKYYKSIRHFLKYIKCKTCC